MKGRKSRVALVGVLTLALAVTVGLLSGSVADAKKKKKGTKSITVAKTTPTVIGPSTPPPPTPPDTVINRSVISVPLTVGKKAKGKVVSFDSLSFSATITGSPRTGAGGPPAGDIPAAASEVGLEIIAPNGRAVGGLNPGEGDENAATIGPFTLTPDSPFTICSNHETGPDGTTTICDVNDPNQVVRPPTYAGTIGDPDLSIFGGVPARGTWTVMIRNFSRMTPAQVNSVSITMGLQAAPTK
jgi:hypothetical protein